MNIYTRQSKMQCIILLWRNYYVCRNQLPLLIIYIYQLDIMDITYTTKTDKDYSVADLTRVITDRLSGSMPENADDNIVGYAGCLEYMKRNPDSLPAWIVREEELIQTIVRDMDHEVLRELMTTSGIIDGHGTVPWEMVKTPVRTRAVQVLRGRVKVDDPPIDMKSLYATCHIRNTRERAAAVPKICTAAMENIFHCIADEKRCTRKRIASYASCGVVLTARVQEAASPPCMIGIERKLRTGDRVVNDERRLLARYYVQCGWNDNDLEHIYGDASADTKKELGVQIQYTRKLYRKTLSCKEMVDNNLCPFASGTVTADIEDLVRNKHYTKACAIKSRKQSVQLHNSPSVYFMQRL